MSDFERSDRTYIVTEVCPHCENEIEMTWDTDERGYQTYCPVCGERLMLCDECMHTEGGGKCDYDSKTDSCYRNPAKEKQGGTIKTGKAIEVIEEMFGADSLGVGATMSDEQIEAVKLALFALKCPDRICCGNRETFGIEDADGIKKSTQAAETGRAV